MSLILRYFSVLNKKLPSLYKITDKYFVYTLLAIKTKIFANKCVNDNSKKSHDINNV